MFNDKENMEIKTRMLVHLFGLCWFLPFMFYTLWAQGLLPLHFASQKPFVNQSIKNLCEWIEQYSAWITLFIQIATGCVLVLASRFFSWEMLGFRRTAGTWFLIALAAYMASYFLCGLFQMILHAPEVGTATREIKSAARQFLPAQHSYGYFLSVILITGPATAIVEEVAFRGILYTWFRSKFGLPVGIAISSLIFGFLHLRFISPGGMDGMATTLQVTLAGAGLAVLYERSGSLWPSIYLHAVNNLIGALQIILPR